MRRKEPRRRIREGGPSLSFFNRCAVFGVSNLDDAIQTLAEGDFFLSQAGGRAELGLRRDPSVRRRGGGNKAVSRDS